MSPDFEQTEERDDDIPAALAPFAFMSAQHAAQASNFLKQRTGASVADFDLHNGFIYMRWPGRRPIDVYPWDRHCLKQLNDDERAAVVAVWQQMDDDLRMSVERGDVEVVAQQSRSGPLVWIPSRVWWLYRIDDWETGSTNDTGSGDALHGVIFRAARKAVDDRDIQRRASENAPSANPENADQSTAEKREPPKVSPGALEMMICDALRARVASWPADQPQPGGDADWKHVEAELHRKIERQLVRRLRVGIVPGATDRGRRRNP